MNATIRKYFVPTRGNYARQRNHFVQEYKVSRNKHYLTQLLSLEAVFYNILYRETDSIIITRSSVL